MTTMSKIAKKEVRTANRRKEIFRIAKERLEMHHISGGFYHRLNLTDEQVVWRIKGMNLEEFQKLFSGDNYHKKELRSFFLSYA